jgi:hypothetical protein
MKTIKKALPLFLLALALVIALGTKLMGQGTNMSLSSLENIYRTAKGTIFGGLPSNKMIIPYPTPSDPDSSLISVFYFNTDNQLQLGTHQSGRDEYIVVDVNSTLGQAETSYLNSPAGSMANAHAQNDASHAVSSVSMAGSKYATHSAYIWDEDPTPVPAAYVPPVPPNMPNQLLMLVQPSGAGDPFNALTFANYTGAGGHGQDAVSIFIYRADGAPLTAATQPAVSASYLDSSSNKIGNPLAGGSLATQSVNGSSVTGFLVSGTLTTMLPANQWAAGSYSLAVSVAPASGFVAPATGNTTLAISPTPLQGSIYTTDATITSLNHGDSLKIDATMNPTDPANPGVAVCTVNTPSALPSLGGLPSGSASGDVSATTTTDALDVYLYH